MLLVLLVFKYVLVRYLLREFWDENFKVLIDFLGVFENLFFVCSFFGVVIDFNKVIIGYVRCVFDMIDWLYKWC